MIHALTSYPPLIISLIKPTVDYPEDAAKIQGNMTNFSYRVMGPAAPILCPYA
jgi:hypothetical protein